MISGKDFITLAGKLVASPTATEAICRTAISRAYYGAYHQSRAFLVDLGIPVSDDHGKVQQCLSESGVTDATRAGGLLAELRGNRIKADYRLSHDVPGKHSFAKENVEVATEIQSLLDQCAHEPLLSAIQLGVERYLNRITRP